MKISVNKSELASNPKRPKWNLVATGDFCISPTALDQSSKSSKPDDWFDLRIRDVIGNAEISIVNYEGVVVDEGATPFSKIGPAVRMDPACYEILKLPGFTHANLANNHVMDFGADFLRKNVIQLSKRSIQTFGVANSDLAAMQPVVSNVKGLKVAIFGFAEYEFGVATESAFGTSWIGHPLALDLVRQAARDYDVTVVVAHGGVEHIAIPPRQRCAQLKRFVDAGANLVIGHHPHVPQGWELYRDVPIFYSLGNFLFHPGSLSHRRSEWSFIPKVSFEGKHPVQIEITPFKLNHTGGIDSCQTEADYQQKFDYLRGLSKALELNPLAAEAWQACAQGLWNRKYKDLLEIAMGKGFKNQLRPLLQTTIRKLRKRRTGLSDGADMPYGEWRRLLLLSLLRTESHRWTIETACE